MESGSSPKLVVVGASAGGIEALSVLVSSLPVDFPAPVVIAQHLEPRRESHLEEILSRRSALPVRTVFGREPLEGGVIFVVPPGNDVNITDSEIQLREQSGSPKPSIDLLLSSAARAVGEQLIAVILTGTGSDGAAGAAAVKKAGGTVIIQNPETAEYPGMPLSLAPSSVDIVSELDEVGQVLQELVEKPLVPVEPDEQRSLDALLAEVREVKGIDFSDYKMPTILRRLQRRIVATGSESIEEYHRYLGDHPDEYQQLVNSFLINVTEFFRDPELFEYLEQEVLPELIEEARGRGNQLRLWSAGCATGEEAYSLAILVAEALGDELGHFNVRVFATDLDGEAVAFARRGIYAHSALENLSQERVDRYFTLEEDGNYRVNKLVRAMVIFGEHDLARRAPFPQIDMVFSRNVLIYFTPELQRRALQLFAYSLRDGGRLVMGKAESASSLSEYFTQAHSHHKIFVRHGDRFLMPPVLMDSPAPSYLSQREEAERESGGERRNDRPFQLRDRGERQGENRAVDNFLRGMPVGIVVVNRSYDVQLINGVARRLLSIHGSAEGQDLLHLLRGEAYTILRPAIDSAFRAQTLEEVQEISTEDQGSGELHHLQIFVYPPTVSDVERPPQTVILVINDVTEIVNSRQQARGALERAEAELERQGTALRRLTEANRQLEEDNQELVRVNEELRSSNEELMISSEEAQASTEEVETLNEELQATNEELETLNEELQATIEELNATNDDLRARSLEQQEMSRRGEDRDMLLMEVLDSVSVAAVVAVDTTGTVLLRNKRYEELFPSGDIPEVLDENGTPLPSEETPLHRAARRETFVMRFTLSAQDGTLEAFEATGRPLSGSRQRGGVVLIRPASGG